MKIQRSDYEEISRQKYLLSTTDRQPVLSKKTVCDRG